MNQLPVKATTPRIATRFTQSKKASYSNCLRRQDVFYNLNEWLEAMGKFSELDDHSFFSSALVQSAHYHGRSSIVERQLPKLDYLALRPTSIRMKNARLGCSSKRSIRSQFNALKSHHSCGAYPDFGRPRIRGRMACGSSS
jgi:hypothetical protein